MGDDVDGETAPHAATVVADAYDSLTQPTRSVYDALVAFVREFGYPPTVRQLGARCNLSSSSTVHTHLATLQRVGLIVRESHKGRPAIRIVGVDTDGDVVRDLARTDAVYKVGGVRGGGTVVKCALCSATGQVPHDLVHDEWCPWLRARKLYADG